MYKEGDLIVNLTLKTIDGEEIEVGKGKWIVLYFYPKDDTPGCTIQAKNFSKLKEEFEKLNVEIIGINKDSEESHRRFIEKHKLKIKLVSDKKDDIAKLFDVEGQIFPSRDTIVIDPVGKIVKIWRKVSASENPYQVLEFIKNISNKD
ncbi:MAG: peroxiredoxin [Candidatus Calescibacterium sp.]|nr:peroxiredoxin [Candidatus Calescibacterium sp.]MCX7971710.1 peroxiredoxin [bacterium]MDW8195316.1 peroxiredoxin [Candidatus Calescibacterium sp.]